MNPSWVLLPVTEKNRTVQQMIHNTFLVRKHKNKNITLVIIRGATVLVWKFSIIFSAVTVLKSATTLIPALLIRQLRPSSCTSRATSSADFSILSWFTTSEREAQQHCKSPKNDSKCRKRQHYQVEKFDFISSVQKVFHMFDATCFLCFLIFQHQIHTNTSCRAPAIVLFSYPK